MGEFITILKIILPVLTAKRILNPFVDSQCAFFFHSTARSIKIFSRFPERITACRANKMIHDDPVVLRVK